METFDVLLFLQSKSKQILAVTAIMKEIKLFVLGRIANEYTNNF